METAGDIAAFIRSKPNMMRVLTRIELLDLPDCWVAAGFIGNAIWDELSSGAVKLKDDSDVDVVYYDLSDAAPERDASFEEILRRTNPEIPWQVRNQARMHLKNGEAPYTDTADAMCRWPETATAIGARSVDDTIEILAPLGVDDLLNMLVRPSPAFAAKRDQYEKRQREKRWRERWPGLKT